MDYRKIIKENENYDYEMAESFSEFETETSPIKKIKLKDILKRKDSSLYLGFIRYKTYSMFGKNIVISEKTTKCPICGEELKFEKIYLKNSGTNIPLIFGALLEIADFTGICSECGTPIVGYYKEQTYKEKEAIKKKFENEITKNNTDNQNKKEKLEEKLLTKKEIEKILKENQLTIFDFSL